MENYKKFKEAVELAQELCEYGDTYDFLSEALLNENMYYQNNFGDEVKTPMGMVREYQEVSGQKPSPELSLTLFKEELKEWVDEYCKSVYDIYEYSPEDELKELADVTYVIHGYANSKGWDLDEALRRVHENNMGRMFQEDGTIKRREDGKVIKRPGYPKVNLEDLV